MQALQAQPQTSAELARDLHCTDRHIRRTIADLIINKEVIATRNGRRILYSLVEEEEKKAAASSSSITAIADIAGNSGHTIADMSAINSGHFDPSGEKIADISENSGHNSGHAKPKNSKQRHRISKRGAEGYGHPPKAPQFDAESGACKDEASSLCPLSYAEFERDFIQFVLVDRKFRDLLNEKASTEKWEVRHVRGLMYIRVPGRHIALQVGHETVTFSSDDPGDMSDIAAWIRETFTGSYADIDSLVNRIRNPQNLTGEELTVVIRHPETIAAIRSSTTKDSRNGYFTLTCPNENTPGLKIYESNNTMRVEFTIHNHAQGVAALNMKSTLVNLLSRIHKTPGIFWEFIQKYYSALHHPLIIDTGGHDFLQALSQMSGQFVDALRTIADKIPAAAPTPEDLKLRELRDAIEALESSELGDIIRTFRDMLNVEENPTKVFLAAWAVWAKRRFKGRVGKADIASLLLRAHDPIPPADVADAIVRLKEVRLLQEDDRLEICFSPAGAEIAQILMAKREGM